MNNHKLKWNFYMLFFILVSTVVLAIYSIINIFITKNNPFEEEMQLWQIGIFIVLFISVILSYIYSIIIMIIQMIKFKFQSLTLTDKGIENTFIFIYILAFILVIPVKFIAWSSVKKIDDTGSIDVKISGDNVKANFLAKKIINKRGFNFCNVFSKNPVTKEVVKSFVDNYTNQ